MPPKKKKGSPQNAFFFYMQAIKPELIREGYDVGDIQVLVALAGPRWQKLDEELKEDYKEKAKRAKSQARNLPQSMKEGRRDCSGQFISERVDTVKIVDEKRKYERAEIEATLHPGSEALDQYFYFVDFMVTLTMADGSTIPCEMGMTEFSIKGGISRTFHRYIKPGPLPLGFRYQAVSTSEKTHKIPVEGMADPDDTYASVWNDMKQFASGNTHRLPPFYSKSTICEQTEFSLAWLQQKSGSVRDQFKVYELECLLYELDSHLEGKRASYDDMKFSLTNLLSTSTFDYDIGTRCLYHEEQETKHCAQGTVKRYCYCFAEMFCERYDIPFTENHLPAVTGDESYIYIAPMDHSTRPPRGEDTGRNQQMERDYRLNTGASQLMSVSRHVITPQQGGGRAEALVENATNASWKGMGRGLGRGRGHATNQDVLRRPAVCPGPVEGRSRTDDGAAEINEGMQRMTMAQQQQQQQQQQLLQQKEQQQQYLLQMQRQQQQQFQQHQQPHAQQQQQQQQPRFTSQQQQQQQQQQERFPSQQHQRFTSQHQQQQQRLPSQQQQQHQQQQHQQQQQQRLPSQQQQQHQQQKHQQQQQRLPSQQQQQNQQQQQQQRLPSHQQQQQQHQQERLIQQWPALQMQREQQQQQQQQQLHQVQQEQQQGMQSWQRGNPPRGPTPNRNQQVESAWPSLPGASSVGPASGIPGVRPSFGRGSRLGTPSLPGSSAWAGSKPAPHPSSAPEPPSAWTGMR